MTDPLTRLAILHGTDKYGYHNYTPRYFGLLQHLRNQPLRMLEIGVGGYQDEKRGGESLAMWRDFFPEAQITGLDIARKTMDLGPRVEIRQGSQVDADCLSRLVSERGPFDVILDDGSHINGHVVETFRLLFADLAPGGVYIIEDVQTAFFPKFGGSLTLEAPNSIAMGLDRVARLQSGQGGGMASIERFHNVIIVHKRAARKKRPMATEDRHVLAAEAQKRKVVTVEAGESGHAEALPGLIAEAGEGGIIALHGAWRDAALLGEIFAQVDHREMQVNFPDALLHDFAGQIAGLSIYPETVLLLVGRNRYPSNFAFDARDPEVAAALAEMGDVLKDKAASENALLRFVRMKDFPGGGAVGSEILDRLQAKGCRDPYYCLQRAEILIDRHQWVDLLSLCRTALPLAATQPRITACLGLALRKTGQGDEALRLLRDAHARMPQALPILGELANAEFDCGDISAGKALLAGAIDRFPADEQAMRLRALIGMARAAGDAQVALTAAMRLQALDPGSVSIRRAPVLLPGG